MASCSEVAQFFQGVSSRNVTSRLAPADLQALQGMHLVQVLSSDDLQRLSAEVRTLQQAQLAISQETAQRAQTANQVDVDTRKTHSILFHLEGSDHQHADLERLQQEQQAVRHIDQDLISRQQAFAQLLVKKSLLDAACPFNGGYVALTTAGRMVLRDLNVRLYRVSGEDFASYWAQSQKVDGDLYGIASSSATTENALAGALPGVDRSYLWAVSIGMAKSGGVPQEKLNRYLGAYNGIQNLSPNLENRLMAAEVLSALPQPLDRAMQSVGLLNQTALQMRIPAEASLGVASILLLGQRADGSFPTDRLPNFLPMTPSFESAALLAIVNKSFADLSGRFGQLKGLFGSWGYAPSEDTELSSAYLAVSDLPMETVAPKLQIISRGLSGYLQYPLVASSILSSIPVLEANETLNLLEKAYEVLGQRTGPMSQAELICLAVRMIHGIQVQSVSELDPTAARVAAAPSFSYANMPPNLWVPVYISHSVYYSTWSGMGGPHPAHVHTWGGGGWGGGFVG